MLEQCSMSQMGKSGTPENIDDGEIEGKVTVFPSLAEVKQQRQEGNSETLQTKGFR